MNTIKMLKRLNKSIGGIIAKSSSGYCVMKDNVDNFVYCHEDGKYDESRGHEGWVCLTEKFMGQKWKIIKE